MKFLNDIYFHAWKSGLKTTYYLRNLAASTIEKSTVTEVVSETSEESDEEQPSAMCSLEAKMRGETCDSCQ